MKKLTLLSFVFIGIIYSMVGCSKNSTGSTGPQGPAGPDNVTYSPWIAFNMTYEGIDTSVSANDSVYFQGISTVTLTQNVLDSDLVLLYVQTDFGTNGAETVIDAADLAPYLDVEYSLNTISLTSYGGNLINYGYTAFRFVIIPGTILATDSYLKNYTKEQLKTADYSVIAKALGISSSGSNTK
jgi:hypothetical protein